MNNTCKKGFTLIELLVVVSIIGVLATVVLGSPSTARDKAKNAKIVQSIRQIQTALNLYYDDNGHYPIAGTAVCLGDYGPSDTCDLSLVTSSAASGNLNVQEMASNYLGSLKYPTVRCDSGEAQDAFFYRCANEPLCTKYNLPYNLNGVNQNCGKLRGLNDGSNGFELAGPGVINTTPNNQGATYCVVTVDNEIPANFF